MKKQLIELLKIIFQRDNEAIDDIMDKFDYDDNHFVRPPEDVEQFTNDTIHQNETPEVNCEFVHGHHHTEEIISNGRTIPEGSVELWFKFFDIRTRRKRIFRLGDYYIRVLNTGFDKWDWDFYIEQYGITDKKLVKTYMRAQHPHISHGTACLAAMETGIRASITNYNLNGFLWRIRSFLNSWNYRSPHWEPERFEHKVIAFNLEALRTAFVSPDRNYPIDRDYWSMFNHTQYEDKWVSQTLGLTSARLKSYDATPISRSITHLRSGAKYLENGQSFIYQNDRGLYHSPQVVYNLTHWIHNNIKTEDITINQALPLCSYLVNKIKEEVKKNQMIVEGDWEEGYTQLIYDITNTREIYVTEYRNEYRGGPQRHYHDVASKLYRLTSQRDNPDTHQEASDLISELNDMSNYINLLKECVIDEYQMNHSEIKDGLYSNLNKVINSTPVDSYAWETVEEFINFVDKFSISRDNEVKNLEVEMDNARNNYECIKSELMNLMREWRIKYHKTELRRLEENGKNTVQIESLNL